MTDQIREQLSALLDGELPRGEVGLLMRRVERDVELCRAFGSYALIGETLRAPGGRVASPAFAGRVATAIDGAVTAAPGVPAVGAVVVSQGAFWKRPAVRTALAAGAAVAAVLVLRPDSTTTTLVAEAQPEAVGFPMVASPTPARSQRLASFMVAHSQYSTPIVRRNVLTGLLAADPGLRNVSFEVGEAP